MTPSNPSIPADTSKPVEATFTFRPPQTLFFGPNATSGLKVKYARVTLPADGANTVTNAPATAAVASA